MRASEEVVQGDREQGRARLATRHNHDPGIGVELFAAQPARGADLVPYAADEVGSNNLARQPPTNLITGELSVGEPLGHDSPRNHNLNKISQVAHSCDYLRIHHVGQVGEDEIDLGVELTLLHAAERLAEYEIANHVL